MAATLAGSSASEGASDVTSTGSAASSGCTNGTEAVYPLTIKTHYGDVTIDKQPVRVVALRAASADEPISVACELNLEAIAQTKPDLLVAQT